MDRLQSNGYYMLLLKLGRRFFTIWNLTLLKLLIYSLVSLYLKLRFYDMSVRRCMFSLLRRWIFRRLAFLVLMWFRRADPESEIAPTWFQYYNKELIRTLSFSEHEAFDHPVACKTLNVFFRKSKIVVFGFMLLLIDFSLVYQSKS